MRKKRNSSKDEHHYKQTDDTDKEQIGHSGYGCRHTLAIMSFLGFMNLYAMRVNLSVALVAMVTHNTTDMKDINGSSECPGNDVGTNSTDDNKNLGEFDWDHKTQGLILGSFFYGYIVTQFPGGWLAGKYGGTTLLGLGMLSTSLLTIFTPFAARWHLGVFFAVRVLEGLGEGVAYPAMHAMWGKWAPLMERSKLCSFCYSGSSFGTVLTLPIAGLLCASDIAGGWPSVFYIFGSLGVLWSISWMLLIRDTPAQHPRISLRERKYIEASLGPIKNAKTPWLEIFTCRAFWGLLVGQFCSGWGFYTLLTNLPTYMKEVLRFDIAQNGILSGIPYLVSLIFMITSGLAADYLRERGILSTTVVRKVFNSSGDLLAALFLVVIQFAGCDVTASFVILVCSVGFSGLHGSGYLINHIDIAPQYAGTIMGITNTAATITGFVTPYVVGVLTNEKQTREQWQMVFYIAAAINTFGVIIFALFAEGEVQSWAKYTDEDETKLLRDSVEISKANHAYTVYQSVVIPGNVTHNEVQM